MRKSIFRLSGDIALIVALKRAGGGVIAKGGEALLAEGHRVMDLSRPEVPVDRGWLRDSGQVTGPSARGNEVTVRLSYGDSRVDYEVPVHERLDVNHPHGKAKYLEDPLKESESGMGDRLARRIGKTLA